MIVAHLDLDAFYAAVEELENPALRTQPLIVGGDPRGRGVVATANYVARRFGIHSAMSCAEALRRCPQAVFVRPRHTLYREYSRSVWETVRGVVPAVIPAEFVAEALAEALIQRSGGTITGARVLIPSAEDAREALAAGLRQHGATVENIAVYRTVPVQADLSGLAKDISRGRIDAVTFTSSSTVRSFVALVGRPAATSGRFVAATIGPITADTARELGIREIIEAEPHTVPGLVESLARRFG